MAAFKNAYKSQPSPKFGVSVALVKKPESCLRGGMFDGQPYAIHLWSEIYLLRNDMDPGHITADDLVPGQLMAVGV